MSTVVREAVLDALRPLRSTIEADGYSLEVSVDNETVEVRLVVVDPSACAECLVPRAIMEPMVARMMRDGGVDAKVTLRYPLTHFDA